MVELSNLVESFLTPGISLSRMQDHFRTIEKWMHRGLQKENSRINWQVYTTEECATVASLLAAFMDSKCWSGSQIGVKEALWCELCLVENPIYLVDVLLQMTSKQGRDAFIHAVGKRVFSLSKTYFENPSSVIRLIALHKWLKNEAQPSMLPSVQNLIENYNTRKLSAWMRERNGNFVEDVDPEQIIHELVDSYELTELVNLLGPPESTKATESSRRKMHAANVISLIDKPSEIQAKQSTINQRLKNSTVRVVKSRRKMQKPDGRSIFLNHVSDGVGVPDCKDRTNLSPTDSFGDTNKSIVVFNNSGEDSVDHESCTMDDVVKQNGEVFKRMYQEYVDELGKTELYGIPPPGMCDVKLQTSTAKENCAASHLSELPPLTNDALPENSLSETFTHKSPFDISNTECGNLEKRSGVNSDSSLPTFKADHRPTGMFEDSLLLSGTPIVKRRRNCSLRSSNKAMGKWRTTHGGKRFSLRIRSRGEPGNFWLPLANDPRSNNLVVPGSNAFNKKNKTAVNEDVPDTPVSKTSLKIPYSLRPRTPTQ
ncbi:uncharacterized protein DEA37_0011215 [Paragonimus westermani]|uniref:Uncharacterized protein n=1 Tax=Paragonimus westermani TaxID=34504 RepID=A0A5J4NZ28_9TREM|nr:uncharacterized protein DEA37_0011215 [Paragonimus westermani]